MISPVFLIFCLLYFIQSDRFGWPKIRTGKSLNSYSELKDAILMKIPGVFASSSGKPAVSRL